MLRLERTLQQQQRQHQHQQRPAASKPPPPALARLDTRKQPPQQQLQGLQGSQELQRSPQAQQQGAVQGLQEEGEGRPHTQGEQEGRGMAQLPLQEGEQLVQQQGPSEEAEQQQVVPSSTACTSPRPQGADAAADEVVRAQAQPRLTSPKAGGLGPVGLSNDGRSAVQVGPRPGATALLTLCVVLSLKEPRSGPLTCVGSACPYMGVHVRALAPPRLQRADVRVCACI